MISFQTQISIIILRQVEKMVIT